MNLKTISRKAYLDMLRQEIEDSGLRSTIEQRLIAIDELCAGMSYPFHREIQEHCSEIYDVLKVFAELCSREPAVERKTK